MRFDCIKTRIVFALYNYTINHSYLFETKNNKYKYKYKDIQVKPKNKIYI